MKLGIQLHVVGLSLADTVAVLDCLGVDRCRSTVHNWVQKADLQLVSGKNTNHVEVDETVIHFNNQRYWLYAVVDPDTNESLHARLFRTRTIVLTKQFLRELAQKHNIADSLFLVDGAPWLHAALFELSLRFQHVIHGNRNAVERLFKELKRRTAQFATNFCHVTANSAETWLQTLANLWNQLI